MNGDGTRRSSSSARRRAGESAQHRLRPAAWQPDHNVYGTNAADVIGAGYGGVHLVGTGADRVYAFGGADSIATGDGGDVIDGGAGNDTLDGGGDADTLLGGAGLDSLAGGAGAIASMAAPAPTRMAGGAGDDAYVVDSAADVVTEMPRRWHRHGPRRGRPSPCPNDRGPGADRRRPHRHRQQRRQPLHGAHRRGHAGGAGGSDTLLGGTGADSLDGGTGADSMAGGAGNDPIRRRGRRRGQRGRRAAVAPTRSSLASTTPWAPPGGAGAGRRRAPGTGNGGANTITGGAGDDSLSGLGGNDVLGGDGGNDLLDGGQRRRHDGRRRGRRHLPRGRCRRPVIGGRRRGPGIDTVIASVDHALGAEVETLVLTGAARRGTGNALGQQPDRHRRGRHAGWRRRAPTRWRAAPATTPTRRRRRRRGASRRAGERHRHGAGLGRLDAGRRTSRRWC